MLLHGALAELPDTLSDAAAEIDQVDLEEAEKTAAAGAQLAEAAGFSAKPLPVREERKTWRTLLEAAEAHHASLIVAGAHGTVRHRAGAPRKRVDRPRPSLSGAGAGRARHDSRRRQPMARCCSAMTARIRRSARSRSPGELFDPQPALVFHFWESWVAEAPALAALSRTVEGMAAELDEIGDGPVVEGHGDGVELRRASRLRRHSTLRASGRARLDGGSRRREPPRVRRDRHRLSRAHRRVGSTWKRVERRGPQQPTAGARGAAGGGPNEPHTRRIRQQARRHRRDRRGGWPPSSGRPATRWTICPPRRCPASTPTTRP